MGKITNYLQILTKVKDFKCSKKFEEIAKKKQFSEMNFVCNE